MACTLAVRPATIATLSLAAHREHAGARIATLEVSASH